MNDKIIDPVSIDELDADEEKVSIFDIMSGEDQHLINHIIRSFSS